MKHATLLRQVLDKKQGAGMLFEKLLAQLGVSVYVEDMHGRQLFGSAIETPVQKLPVSLDGKPVGWVSSSVEIPVVAEWLNYQVTQEAGRKKMGAEVLNLYREINLIYNFSEKLADALEPAAIAQMALEEANRLLTFSSGVVILWDEQYLRFEILASRGMPLLRKSDLFRDDHYIRKIAASDRTEIADDLPADGAEPMAPVEALMYAALKVKNRSIGSIILANSQAMNYTAADLKLLTTLALQSASALESALLHEKTIQEAQEREDAIRRVHEVASKFVPFEFLRALGRNSLTDLRLGDHAERTVTVMFTDVRDYTTRAEQMAPAENFRFVNELNGLIGPLIRKHNGFVNQYLGDGVMAIFPGAARDALNAAIAIQKNVQQFNKDHRYKPGQALKIGIGMHTGSLIMGITGDRERMDAATISDTVNTAARIEGLTKFYQASILLSKETLEQVTDSENFSLRYLGQVRVKGKQAAVHIHECFDGDVHPNRQGKLATGTLFSRALAFYYAKDFTAAALAFQEAALLNDKDETIHYFLEKSKQYTVSGVPENWTGVEAIATQ